MNRKLRIAFIKFGGLSAGGTERWLQMMAANLPRDAFDIDYYYCNAAPYVGSDYRHADTNPHRLQYMKDHGVSLVKFHVGAKDITKPTHDWVDTDFWKLFDASRYDFVQTAKAGPAEYPYYLMKSPVVEYVTLLGVDYSPNIAFTILASQWHRARWVEIGGQFNRSSAIPIPSNPPASTQHLRNELGIPADAVVAGLLQRNDDAIYSSIPLDAFASIEQPGRYFLVMGGGPSYRAQAQQLGLKNVRVLPHSGDPSRISAFLNTLDIFAHGRKDGELFGTVLAEALMHGKPCLSHRTRWNNAQPDAMGPAGLFAEDLSDYREKLGLLFTDTALRQHLAAKARPHAERYYSLRSCVDSLADIYRSLIRDGGRSVRSTVSYALSPLGFLYAGPIEAPDSAAAHLISGRLRDDASLHLLRYFLPEAKGLVELGAHDGLHSFVAAREAPEKAQICLVEPHEECVEWLQTTIVLNNWESRVQIIRGANDLADAGQALASLRVDWLKLDAPAWEQSMDACKHIIVRDQPVVFLKPSGGAEQIVAWLQTKGYRLWQMGFRGTVRPETGAAAERVAILFALPPTRADITPIRAWMRRYRWGVRVKSLRQFAWRFARAFRHPRGTWARWRRDLRSSV